MYEWTDNFESGRTIVTDDERSGRPSRLTSERNNEQNRTLILDNTMVTVGEVANQIQISRSSAYEIIIIIIIIIIMYPKFCAG
jgi:transposase